MRLRSSKENIETFVLACLLILVSEFVYTPQAMAFLASIIH